MRETVDMGIDDEPRQRQEDAVRAEDEMVKLDRSTGRVHSKRGIRLCADRGYAKLHETKNSNRPFTLTLRVSLSEDKGCKLYEMRRVAKRQGGAQETHEAGQIPRSMGRKQIADVSAERNRKK